MNFTLKNAVKPLTFIFFSFLKQQKYHRTNDVKPREMHSWPQSQIKKVFRQTHK